MRAKSREGHGLKILIIFSDTGMENGDKKNSFFTIAPLFKMEFRHLNQNFL
jgi:hypothetical protein